MERQTERDNPNETDRKALRLSRHAYRAKKLEEKVNIETTGKAGKVSMLLVESGEWNEERNVKGITSGSFGAKPSD